MQLVSQVAEKIAPCVRTFTPSTSRTTISEPLQATLSALLELNIIFEIQVNGIHLMEGVVYPVITRLFYLIQ
jgi:hypothetical protein